MLSTTLPHLRCPTLGRARARCGSELRLGRGSVAGGQPETVPLAPGSSVTEIRFGQLECLACRAVFPIVAGVAVLMDDVNEYFAYHAKGIARVVPDRRIPTAYLTDYLEAKSELRTEQIEEDLEAERVNALYFMNHYLSAEGSPAGAWWKPRAGGMSPLIDQLVREHWDRGPFAQITAWVADLPEVGDVIELACGVGGLYPRMRRRLRSYLGVDSSFASIALARHLALGLPYPEPVRIPEDLLHGTVSRKTRLPSPEAPDGSADFVVGDMGQPPLADGRWDLSLSLNAIDMLEDPATLPALQARLLRPGGRAIQSCPYIWHEFVARRLRAQLPRGIQDSARAVEWLYEQAGFAIQARVDHLPWLFLKHPRQLEVYSVHLFLAALATR